VVASALEDYPLGKPKEGSVSEPTKLDTAGLYLALRTFEASYERKTGEHVASAVMYDRYKAGELDDPFTGLWMTFFEALERRAVAEGEDPAAILAPTLEPLVVA
jgi:hypothetical protein